MAGSERARTVAVVGATGAVGEVLLRVLEERRFPVGELRALASDESANHPGEGRSVVVEPTLRLVVDRTPPRFEIREGGARRFEISGLWLK